MAIVIHSNQVHGVIVRIRPISLAYGDKPDSVELGTIDTVFIAVVIIDWSL